MFPNMIHQTRLTIASQPCKVKFVTKSTCTLENVETASNVRQLCQQLSFSGMQKTLIKNTLQLSSEKLRALTH